jgi:hypothetical protein
MIYGFENDKFYVEYSSCSRKSYDLKTESEIRARELYAQSKKLILCLSSGLESQIALHSFKTQGIPIECVFFRLGGYNDHEYANLQILENKYNFKSQIIYLDPNTCKEELFELTKQFDAHVNHCLQYKLVEQLPTDYTILQSIQDPWYVVDSKTNRPYVMHSYYDADIARLRTLKRINRSAEITNFGYSDNLWLSSISDPLLDNFFTSWKFYNNNLTLDGQPLKDIYKFDYYIKPILYSKHWGDQLEYFPKSIGIEKIDWIYNDIKNVKPKNTVVIPRNNLIELLSNDSPITKRYYQID